MTIDTSAGAIPAQGATPLAAAQAAFSALNAGDWATAAALMDEADTDAWYHAYLEAGEPDAQPTLDELLQLEPSVSREVAAYRLEQLRLTRELYTGIGNDFVEISTREQLAELTPVEALAAFLQAQDPAWRFARHVRRRDAADTVFSCPEPPARRRTAIGVVAEDEQSASVAYRLFWSDDDEDSPAAATRVATLRRSPAGWRLRLTGELLKEDGFTVIREGQAGLPAS